MTTERLLGSYLVRISLSDHQRRLAVHSVLTGERRTCADFADLAAYLDAATAEAARGRGTGEHVSAEDPTDAEASAPGDDLGSEGHGR